MAAPSMDREWVPAILNLWRMNTFYWFTVRQLRARERGSSEQYILCTYSSVRSPTLYLSILAYAYNNNTCTYLENTEASPSSRFPRLRQTVIVLYGIVTGGYSSGSSSQSSSVCCALTGIYPSGVTRDVDASWPYHTYQVATSSTSIIVSFHFLFSF